ncbi:glycosyltransferase family 2 protein [bacterium]|nr:glycosyltransferase family 2 protein [bacterium]
MDLSIIIVNWNSTEALKNCLNSVNQYTVGIALEIIAADNNSEDINPDAIQKEFPKVKFYFNKNNMGYSKANNYCAKNAKGKFLLFLNPDTILTSGSAASMLDFIGKNKKTGAVGGIFLNLDGSFQRFYRRFPRIHYIVFYATLLAKVFPDNKYAKEYQYFDENFLKITAVDQPGTSFFMISRELFEKLNGFDENMPIFFNDSDLCKRIKKMEYEIYVLPNAKVFHLEGESIKKEKHEVIILEGALSLITYFNKHETLAHAWIMKGIILFDQLLRLLYGLSMHLIGRQSGDKYLYRGKIIYYLLFNKRIVTYG